MVQKIAPLLRKTESKINDNGLTILFEIRKQTRIILKISLEVLKVSIIHTSKPFNSERGKKYLLLDSTTFARKQIEKQRNILYNKASKGEGS